MSKKILIVWSGDYPWDIRISKQVTALRKNNYEVHILARNTRNEKLYEIIDGVYIHRIHHLISIDKVSNIITTPIYFNPVWCLEIFNCIKNVKPDLIIIRDIPLILAVISIAKIFKIKTVLDMAEHFPALMKVNPKYNNNPISKFVLGTMNLYEHIEKEAVKNCNFIFTVVEESKNRLMSEYKIKPEKFAVISNTPEFIPALNDKTETDILRIIYVGNIDFEFRGLQTVIETARLLQDFPVLFNIVGDGAMKEPLEKLCREYNLKNVVFKGKIPHEQLKKEFDSNDLGIVPHTKTPVIEYTIPNKIYDYMSNRMPIIVSDAKPLKRIAEENACGYVFEAENPKSLANVINMILKNKQELPQKGLNGYNAVLEKYNWNKDAQNMLKIIEELSKESL